MPKKIMKMADDFADVLSANLGDEKAKAVIEAGEITPEEFNNFLKTLTKLGVSPDVLQEEPTDDGAGGVSPPVEEEPQQMSKEDAVDESAENPTSEDVQAVKDVFDVDKPVTEMSDEDFERIEEMGLTDIVKQGLDMIQAGALNNPETGESPPATIATAAGLGALALANAAAAKEMTPEEAEQAVEEPEDGGESVSPPADEKEMSEEEPEKNTDEEKKKEMSRRNKKMSELEQENKALKSKIAALTTAPNIKPTVPAKAASYLELLRSGKMQPTVAKIN